MLAQGSIAHHHNRGVLQISERCGQVMMLLRGEWQDFGLSATDDLPCQNVLGPVPQHHASPRPIVAPESSSDKEKHPHGCGHLVCVRTIRELPVEVIDPGELSYWSSFLNQALHQSGERENVTEGLELGDVF